MSELERLAGSTIVTGVPGPDASPETLAALNDLGPGGVVLFDRNVSTVEGTRALVRALRDAAGGTAPALVCVDQEGGRVARLRFRDPGMPSMLTVGAARDLALAERAGAALAYDVANVGGNVDFAPVLDLALEPHGTVIGTRSFGDDPDSAGRLGAALIRGVQGRGVAAVAKHFPGHGATARDSHEELPFIDVSADVLRARDLVPFAAAVAAGVRAVMTAHVVVRAFDAERPASLSRAIATDVLRGELGFTGVCFTDCLQMNAVARGFGTAGAGVAALAAGADALLVSHDIALASQLRAAIVAAVRAGDVPLARLEEAAGRIAELRATLARESDGARLAPEDDDERVAFDVALRGVAIVRGHAALDVRLPVTVVSFEGAASDGIARSRAERPSLSLALRRRRYRSELMRVPLDPDPETIALLLDVLRAQGDRALVVIARRAHRHPLQAAAVTALTGVSPHAIVVSALEPFDVPLFADANVVLCTFGDEAANVAALADILSGGASALGALPVRLSTTPARRLLSEAEIDAKLPHAGAT
jgi:beta-N-acetylhexosaminidase